MVPPPSSSCRRPTRHAALPPWRPARCRARDRLRRRPSRPAGHRQPLPGGIDRASQLDIARGRGWAHHVRRRAARGPAGTRVGHAAWLAERFLGPGVHVVPRTRGKSLDMTTSDAVTSATDARPMAEHGRVDALRRMSSTFSTPACPLAAKPQGRPGRSSRPGRRAPAPSPRRFPADAAVEHHLDLLADGGGQRRQGPDRRRRAVEVVAGRGSTR